MPIEVAARNFTKTIRHIMFAMNHSISRRQRQDQYLFTAVLILLNFIFFEKYASRVTQYSLYLAFSLGIGQGFLYFNERISTIATKYTHIIAFGALLCIVAATVVTHFTIDLNLLKVDRWSVITSFIQTLEAGNYPYNAQSNFGNYPGPMPIYYLVAYPFYKLGVLEVLSAVGYLTIISLLYKFRRRRPVNVSIILLLISSPVMYWEIATRSNIVTFTTLAVLSLEGFRRYIRIDEGRPNAYIYAVINGLSLSTRSVIALPLIVYYSKELFHNGSLIQLVKYSAITIGTFILTLLPFYLIWPDAWTRMNPFIIQSDFLLPSLVSTSYVSLVVLLSLLISTRRCGNLQVSGLVILLLMGVYVVYGIVQVGFWEAYYGSWIDLSYLLLVLPFFLLSEVFWNDNINGTTVESV